MSVLTHVEKKSWKGKTFLTLVTVALVVGSATMIYPFALMLAGSIRSPMDTAQRGFVPSFLHDDVTLGRKFVEAKYAYSVRNANAYRFTTDISFETAAIPEPVIEARVEDLESFVEDVQLPDHWKILGGVEMHQRTLGFNQRRFIRLLKDRYDNDLGALARDLGAPFESWLRVFVPLPEWTNPRFSYEPSLYYDAYFELMRQRPLGERGFAQVSGAFLENMVFPQYGKVDTGEGPGRERFERFRNDYGLTIDSYRQFALPRRYPASATATFRENWGAFAREVLNTSFVRADANDEQYRAFLRRVYDGDLAKLNAAWLRTDDPLPSFEAITLPGPQAWIPAGQRRDYRRFVESRPVESLYLVGPEYDWRQWLAGRYDSLEDLNRAHRAAYPAVDAVPIPIAHAEQAYVQANATALRIDFSLSNFHDVFDEIVLQGRPLFNTVVFVTLSVFFSLLLQPMAAYGLSRFDPPGTWRLILILMATMAFPPMVGLIPQFLILRTFDLLNTFLALLLPTVVNGYLIFLLKGFFDSLPKHLYEAALIDGASEMRMFLSITMALSKPILAVVALNSFNAAWMMFMYPLLVAPDPDMHVLAVWLYEFQQDATQPAVFASILITSIPTLVIFLITQRTIMRGIAVPAEK